MALEVITSLCFRVVSNTMRSFESLPLLIHTPFAVDDKAKQ
jgi:hypothetical protein